MTPYALYVLDLTRDFYSADHEASRVDVDYVLGKCDLEFDNPNKANIYKEYAREVFALDVSAVNTAELLYDTVRKAKAAELAQSLINDKEDVKDKLAEHVELLEAKAVSSEEDSAETEIITNLSVEEINKQVLNPSGLIKIATKSLTDRLDGGVLPGTHIIVFARPETGKTAFALTCIRSFCKQGLRVAYFGNEDPILSIVERFQGCLSGMPKLDRLRDPRAAQKVLDANGYANASFVAITPGTIEEIAEYCEEHEPDAVLIDQLRNLNLKKAENRTTQLETLANGARWIGKKYGPVVISFTQAGDSATNKLCLEMGDVDSSNTGIPAQADVMIGLGMTPEFDSQGLRKINLPKNKVSGKHENWNVKINPFLSLIEDL